ncbi:MAG TPA: copper chaperone PCu(A)C [Rhodanobacteraceae bacterium]|nr:copper chaperone PCu(A)C [Rhodanobacteraceae bacterium]
MITLRGITIAALLAVTTTAVAATPAPAGVRVEHAWIRWLPANLPAAGYATIVNDGDATLRLTGATSADYQMVMLHHSRLASGDSTMEKVDGLDIPAHASVKLAPGGYHLMLSHATHPIKPGDKVAITLEFTDGATLQTDFSVLPSNSAGPAD